MLNLVDYYNLDYDFNIPSPTKNNIFVFLGKSKDQVVIYFRKNKLQAINLMDDNNFIHIINLVNYISLEEKSFFVFNFRVLRIDSSIFFWFKLYCFSHSLYLFNNI